MNVTHILYRGSLSSCNYACGYCPFAKTRNTRKELDLDRSQLERFVDWVADVDRPVGIMITPWGEAIIHRYYRDAMTRLSWMDSVRRIAIQTNLSGHLKDLSHARVDRLAVWATYHPGETEIDRFLNRCGTLERLGIRFSVGVVGFREHFGVIQELRQRLAGDVYLWVNIPKSSGIRYSDDELRFLESIDPYFRWNARRWPSLRKPCRTGSEAFAVDGDGNVRRCHFVDEQIGNLYTDDIWTKLSPSACPNNTCGCHIGYVHRDDFPLDRLFEDDVLARIPGQWPEIDHALTDPAITTIRSELPQVALEPANSDA